MPANNSAPYQAGAPNLGTAVQQFLGQYQAEFLNNQRAYNNVVAKVSQTDSKTTLSRACTMAEAIESERRSMPFGMLMAQCERECGFDWTKQESKFRKDGTFKYAEAAYGVGPYGMTAPWDSGKTWNGLSKADAMDPVKATRGIIKYLLWKSHVFIMANVPAAKQDIVFYTWLMRNANAAGPGNLSAAEAYLNNPSQIDMVGGQPWFFNGSPKKGKHGKGLAGTVARAFYKYKKITLNTCGDSAWMRSPDYSNAEGVFRLFLAGIRAPVWEARRDKLLKRDIKSLNDASMIVAAIQKAKTTGQAAALDAFKPRQYALDRANASGDASRSDEFDGARTGSSDAAKRTQGAISRIMTRANAEDVANLPIPDLSKTSFLNFETGTWDKGA